MTFRSCGALGAMLPVTGSLLIRSQWVSAAAHFKAVQALNQDLESVPAHS